MRAWVTGATGQIGRKLCVALKLAGHEVITFSRTGTPVSPDYQSVQWDMSRDIFDVEKVAPPSVVFHLASQTSAYKARDDLPRDVTTNVLGFVRLLEVLKRTESFPHVILAGAATEVGITGSVVINDFDADQPITFYDVGKVSQRLYLRQSGFEGWLEGTTLRLPNVYGGVESNSSNDRGFLNTSIRRALLGHELRYYFDGDYIRDFLHVDDVVAAMMSAMNQRSTVANETFVIGSGIGTRIRDALAEIAAQAEGITQKPVPMIGEPAPSSIYKIETRNVVVDATRYVNRTGWRATIPFEEGIRRTTKNLLSRS